MKSRCRGAETNLKAGRAHISCHSTFSWLYKYN